MKLTLLILSILLLLSNNLLALEIKNAKVSTEGNVLKLSYDLLGKPGERKATVKVAVVLDGERYKPGTINIVGDYGLNIPIGRGKCVKWDLIKDMPAGFVGTLTWEIDADPELSYDPFNLMGTKNKVKPPIISDGTVSDPKSKLTWLRSPFAIKPVTSIEAASSIITKMNQSKYLGYSDWRLPKKDEYETLFKMLEVYGYNSGQSSLPYFEKIGFKISREAKFWVIDKSSIEFKGKEVFVSGVAQSSGSSTSNRSTYRSYPRSGGGRYTTNTDRSYSGSAEVSGNFAVRTKDENSGLDSLCVDTKDSYFYKHNGVDQAFVLAVRGGESSEVYAVTINSEVSINP